MSETVLTAVGVLIPFAGTSLGAAMVFFMRRGFRPLLQKALLGFASGVMMAATVWSLLIPAIEQSASLGRLSFLPATAGFGAGIALLLLIDRLVPHLHLGDSDPEGPRSGLAKTFMMVLAVAIHNLPEGMAVGAVFAGFGSGSRTITLTAAFALSAGIAIQNFPEGAIVSMPLCAEGWSRRKAFGYGVLSGLVEPVGAVAVILLSGLMLPMLPYLLGFAAGAMIYVIVEETIPEASAGHHSNIGTVGFAAGFAVMMILDVALG